MTQRVKPRLVNVRIPSRMRADLGVNSEQTEIRHYSKSLIISLILRTEMKNLNTRMHVR